VASNTFAIGLAALSDEKKKEFLKKCSPQELEAIKWDWKLHAREKQLPPKSDPFIWLLMTGRGFGKALSLDTPIPSPDGWTTMGDLDVGDRVFDENGQPAFVSYVSPVYLGNTCYDVKFSDWSVITADAGHQWLTWTHAARKAFGRARDPRVLPEVATTEQIRSSLLHLGKEHNHSIPTCKPLNYEAKELSIDPYILGVWLGDGSSSSGELTTVDPFIVEEIERRGEPCKEYRTTPDKAARYGIGCRPEQRDPQTGQMVANGSVHSRLRELGLLKNKHIPGDYLRASVEQRRELLAGLLDTDGHCWRGHVEFCNTNRRLAYGTLELIFGLGFKARLYEGEAKLDGRVIGPKYRIHFTPHEPHWQRARCSE